MPAKTCLSRFYVYKTKIFVLLEQKLACIIAGDQVSQSDVPAHNDSRCDTHVPSSKFLVFFQVLVSFESTIKVSKTSTWFI